MSDSQSGVSRSVRVRTARPNPYERRDVNAPGYDETPAQSITGLQAVNAYHQQLQQERAQIDAGT